MNKLQLFRELRQHRKLAAERMVDVEKNKVAKWLMRFLSAFVILYLLMFAVSFALIANSLRTMSSLEFICTLIPLFFIIDFFFRFAAQQTPSQMIKPYVLLPIGRHTCVDFFITGQMLDSSNLIWFFMLVPYCIMSVLFSYGFWASIGLLLFFWIFELCISQFYLIVRTIINDSLWWWLIPVALIIGGIAPGLNIAEHGYTLKALTDYDLDKYAEFYGSPGLGIEEGHLWPFLLVISLCVLLFFINRYIQQSHVMSELSRVEKAMVIKNASDYKFLERFGQIGMFIGLELKTTFRNKNPRKAFIMGVFIVVLFSAICTVTTVYDSPYMGNFWCIYNYCIFGATTLIKVMANEGNYIDGLMVRRENILQILTAKYWFNCAFLLIPFTLMLVPVISGKWSLLMVLSFGLFTAGFQYFLLFQLAVINRASQPLNTKFISKNGIENNKWQIIIEMFCMFVPVIFVSVLETLWNDTAAYVIMFIIGCAFIATHRLWLRNIYNRFMRRRYINMEGFRATR